MMPSPDLAGPHYCDVLASLHRQLRPRSYFEVGTQFGNTLALAECAAVAVDPVFSFQRPDMLERVLAKPSLCLFQMPSDAFFARHDLTAVLGHKVDLAFLDGMHRCEFVLRDFMNTERHCHANSVIVLHDCLPVEAALADRVPHLRAPEAPHRRRWWAGDTWRTALLLRRVRPDLVVTAIDAAPTGLLLVTGLDPCSTVLSAGYDGHVAEMLGWELEAAGIPALFAELDVRRTADVLSPDALAARFAF